MTATRTYALTLTRVGTGQQTETRHATRDAALEALRAFAADTYGIHHNEISSGGTLTSPCGRVAAYGYTIR